MLKEKKLSRYFLYAGGEILLVMIGILLALQVNNWNERRKTNNLEIQLLKEIKAGLTTDLQDIAYNIQAHSKILKSQNVVRDWLDSDAPYFDSLSHHLQL